MLLEVDIMEKKPAIAENMPLVIAIDGPAASGKGTLARKVAHALGVAYLDTGSLYRAVAWKLLAKEQPLDNIPLAVETASGLILSDLENPELKSERVGMAASAVSVIPAVREALLHFQRNFAYSGKGAVLDGRDIGTVICPDAKIKLFITADIATRAKRRHEELLGLGQTLSYEEVLKELEARDNRDRNRTVAPLVAAADAIIIDTTAMDSEEAFRKTMGVIENRNRSL